MENSDIRWKQRFNNFKKAMHFLMTALAIEKPDVVQKAGIVQFFELSYELAWNLLKDYLEDQGFADVKTPRAAFKKAFEVGLVANGQVWMNLLRDRNMTTHIYDEQQASEIESLIRTTYYPVLAELLQKFERGGNVE